MLLSLLITQQENSKAFDVIVASLSESLEVSADSIKVDSSLNEFGLDFINFVNLVIALEMEFDFEFDDDKLLISKFPTVLSLIEYVDEKVQA